MPERIKTKFGIKIDRIGFGMPRTWSVGICLTKDQEETYIFINLFRISISIGKLYDFDEFGEI